MATRDTGGQQRTTRTREETDEVEASVDTDVAERHQEMTEDIDSILDEIDEVLEENSEEFVRSYVQKGGQGPFSEQFLIAPVSVVAMKYCSDCGEPRPIAEFTRDKRRKDG